MCAELRDVVVIDGVRTRSGERANKASSGERGPTTSAIL